MPEWTKGADCKSVCRGFESHSGLSVITQNLADAKASPQPLASNPKPLLSRRHRTKMRGLSCPHVSPDVVPIRL